MKIFCKRCRRWFGRHSYECLIEIHLERYRSYKKIISSTVPRLHDGNSVLKTSSMDLRLDE